MLSILYINKHINIKLSLLWTLKKVKANEALRTYCNTKTKRKQIKNLIPFIIFHSLINPSWPLEPIQIAFLILPTSCSFHLALVTPRSPNLTSAISIFCTIVWGTHTLVEFHTYTCTLMTLAIGITIAWSWLVVTRDFTYRRAIFYTYLSLLFVWETLSTKKVIVYLYILYQNIQYSGLILSSC